MFENLAERLQNTMSALRGKGKLTEKDIDVAMREVKLSLLEADVNFKVVKEFIKHVKERALGQEVMESLTPGQQVIKIVRDELQAIMGDKESKIEFNTNGITYIMMCGLQGAGKTTTTGKLALQLKNKGKNPLLVACDIYRPAAIKQLQVVGESVGVDVFEMGNKTDVVTIAKEATKFANSNGKDVVIIDTAGRLHVDEELMDELVKLKEFVTPQEILLVLDAMTGQDAVRVAETFNGYLDVTGVVLTKVDGDARGGAALSIKKVVDKPIKYVAVGEKMDQLEVFHPDRMASRILGMGDILSLIDKAQLAYDENEAAKLQEKIKTQSFDLNDFLSQLQQMKNMGPLEDLIKMIPGANSKALKGATVDEKELVYTEAIIQSMTQKERENPSMINGSRRKRIAKGSGTSVQRVNRLLKQFEDMKKMMKQMSAFTKGSRFKKGKSKLNFPF